MKPDMDNLDRQQLLRDWRTLSQWQPDSAAADRAVAKALATLASGGQSPPALHDPAPSPSHHFHIRRWLIPAGIAASLIVGLTLWWTFLTSTPLSAAETLRQAVENQAAYDGWVRIEGWLPATQEWKLMALQNERLQRRLIVTDDRTCEPFVYVDVPAKIMARYNPTTKTLRVSQYVPHSGGIEADPMPITEEGLLEMMDSSWYRLQRLEKGDAIWIVMTKIKPDERPQQKKTRSYDYLPARMAVEVDAKTLLLRQVRGQQTEAEAERPFGRFIYDAKGISSLEDLPTPPDTRIEDVRAQQKAEETPAQVKAQELLDQVDAILEKGIGLDTAILIQRNLNPSTGEFASGNRVTVFDRHGNCWLKGEWDIEGSRPVPKGWPTPSFEAVIEAVTNVKPASMAVYDGQQLWNSQSDGSPMVGRTVSARSVRLQYAAHGVAPLFWTGRGNHGHMTMCEKRTFEAVSNPDQHNELVLKITTYARWQDKPDQLMPSEVTTVRYRTDFGPMSRWVEKVQYASAEGKVFNRRVWKFELTPMESFRAPIYVPLRWRYYRTSELSEREGIEPWPTYYRLFPFQGKHVPEDWLNNPARWDALNETAPRLAN